MAAQEQPAERVLREDLVLFVNGCFAATGQSEFYAGAREQSLSLEFVHAYILGNYRDLYTLVLATGINDHNASLIVANLLSNPLRSPTQQLEGELIRHALRRMPPQRVYRLFRRLRRARVNNRRTRAVIRDYIAWRGQWELDAMKYRRGLTDAARHAHLGLPGEIGPFLFEWKTRKSFATDALEAWRAAHYAKEAVYKLPFSVAEGLAARHGISRKQLMTRASASMTRGERGRLHRAAGRAGVDLGASLDRMPLLRLMTYVLSMPIDERRERMEELARAAAHVAARAGHASPLGDVSVCAVLDNSYSSRGTRERRNRPLAVALGAHYLLRAMFPRYRAVWTHAPRDGEPLFVQPQGQTAVADRLLDALQTGSEWVVIVSDGWENDPPGGVHAVAELVRRELDPHMETTIVQINPVFDPRSYEPKQLSPLIPCVGVRTPNDIVAALGFARFAAGAETGHALAAYLRERATALCSPGGAA